LVGTKADLRQDQNTINALANKGLSLITPQESNGLATQIGAIKSMECSALTQEGLKNVFDEAIRAAMNKSKPKKSGSCCVVM